MNAGLAPCNRLQGIGQRWCYPFFTLYDVGISNPANCFGGARGGEFILSARRHAHTGGDGSVYNFRMAGGQFLIAPAASARYRHCIQVHGFVLSSLTPVAVSGEFGAGNWKARRSIDRSWAGGTNLVLREHPCIPRARIAMNRRHMGGYREFRIHLGRGEAGERYRLEALTGNLRTRCRPTSDQKKPFLVHVHQHRAVSGFDLKQDMAIVKAIGRAGSMELNGARSNTERRKLALNEGHYGAARKAQRPSAHCRTQPPSREAIVTVTVNGLGAQRLGDRQRFNGRKAKLRDDVGRAWRGQHSRRCYCREGLNMIGA